MFSPDQYQLLDFGDGRRLERFGHLVLDRPAPAAAELVRQQPQLWQQVDGRFQRHHAAAGRWVPDTLAKCTWRVSHGPCTFELRCTDSGAVGLFAEQADNWDWLAHHVQRAGRPLKILNLFAYTGGSTLAAVAAGATELVHVDAARSAVQWARRNAELSGLADAPVRWIVEDARQFVRREVRRGQQYDGVILDPPTYGHGPQSQPWKFATHVEELLGRVRALSGDRLTLALFTCHTPGVRPEDTRSLLARHLLRDRRQGIETSDLWLTTRDGRRLRSGVVARWFAT